jgi:hypothetical protein
VSIGYDDFSEVSVKSVAQVIAPVFRRSPGKRKGLAGTGSSGGLRSNPPRPLGAQGIAAETPQDLHGQIRGVGAESPVFCLGKKCANILEKKEMRLTGFMAPRLPFFLGKVTFM